MYLYPNTTKVLKLLLNIIHSLLYSYFSRRRKKFLILIHLKRKFEIENLNRKVVVMIQLLSNYNIRDLASSKYLSTSIIIIFHLMHPK